MSRSNQTNWDVLVAGGGPAGFFAAIRCAELNPKLRVLIIEKARQTLGKVIISGGGRCNVTHACFDPVQLITYYPRGGTAFTATHLNLAPAHLQWSRSIKREFQVRCLTVSIFTLKCRVWIMKS